MSSDCGLQVTRTQSIFAIGQTGTTKNIRCGGGSDSGSALKDNDAVGEVRRHYEIVLDNEGRLLRV